MYNEVMRFEVPQFIEIEDKIFGPLTWRQFVYLAGGAAVVVVTFLALPLFIFLLTGVPIAILAFFLAFHKINNRPFVFFLESAINYFFGNKLYLWRRRHKDVVHAQTDTPVSPKTQEVPTQTHLPKPDSSSISSLSRKLEIDSLEIKE